jgi:hypothetical protein
LILAAFVSAAVSFSLVPAKADAIVITTSVDSNPDLFITLERFLIFNIFVSTKTDVGRHLRPISKTGGRELFASATDERENDRKSAFEW